jgi:coatomer protein complex subunit gamma
MYVTADDKATFQDPFDIAAIPVVTKEQADAEDRTKKLTTVTPTIKAPKAGPTKTAPTGAEAIASASAAAQKYQEELLKIPEMKQYGSVLKSSPVVELTESETEYVVSVVKHIFKDHVVLQYEVKNTLPDTVLEDVSVVATPSEESDFEEEFIIPAAKLVTDEPGTIYVSFRFVNGAGSLPVSSFTNILKFMTKEIDPTTGEPEESMNTRLRIWSSLAVTMFCLLLLATSIIYGSKLVLLARRQTRHYSSAVLRALQVSA